MSGPVHMNQVIFQTPSVEKVHQAEHQTPDQGQRQATVEEQEQMRQRTETVQRTDSSEHTQAVKNDKEERERSRKRKHARGDGTAPGEEEQARPHAERDAGSIVDVII